MTIQDLPAFYDMIYTEKDGRMTRDSYLYNDQTFQSLNYTVFAVNGVISTYVQPNLTFNPFGLSPVPQPESLVIIGINPPSFTTAQITAIAASVPPNPTVPIGTIWYNSTLDKLQFLGAGNVVRTVTSV